jgi:hypothetical protein
MFSPKKILLALSLALAVAVTATITLYKPPLYMAEPGTTRWVTESEAQGTFAAVKNGNGTHGLAMSVWNTTDSVLFHGDLVMWDTTTAATSAGGVKRYGVRRYLGVLSDRKRVAGWAFGDISKSSQGGRGAILVFGYHNGIKTSTSGGIVAGSPFRISTINGAVVNAGDSLSMEVGYCTGGTAGVLNTVSHIKGYVNALGLRVGGSL